MATSPLITFKAGRCDASGKRVTPIRTPGYLYLYSEDELVHLCWRTRDAPSTSPELDLITIPGDATFTPLVKEPGAEDVRSPTNGRIFVLRFSSSGEKQYFWMQSKTQHKEGDLSWFSQRDQRVGQVVDALLSGEVDVETEIDEIRQLHRNGGGEGEDLMDLDGQDDSAAAAPSTSQPQDASALVQNFLNSLGGSNQQQNRQQADKPFTTLPDLLTSATTIPYVDSCTPAQLDTLCNLLPPDLFLLNQESESLSATQPTPAAAQAAIEGLSTDQKREIVKKVLRSPQLQQSLGSLTVALRDGGLPMIGDALGLRVANGGLIRGGNMPLGGGEAVEAFVEGVKKTVEEGEQEEGDDQEKR